MGLRTLHRKKQFQVRFLTPHPPKTLTRPFIASRHPFLKKSLGFVSAKSWKPSLGAKIMNIGTNSYGGPVEIAARPLRPFASEGLDVSLSHRSSRLREPISR